MPDHPDNLLQDSGFNMAEATSPTLSDVSPLPDGTSQEDTKAGEIEEGRTTIIDLPDLVLVKILSYMYLDVGDVFNTVLTCHRMNDIMNHPAAWSSVRMRVLSGDTDLHNEKYKTSRYLAMVERFGTYFQDLDFSYVGYCQGIKPDVKELIDKLGAKCRLKNLVISVYFVETKSFHHGNFNVIQLKEHYDAVCSLVARCEHLKSFSLRGWPARQAQPDKNEILDALCANERNNKLEKLHMFWPDRTEKNWVDRRTNQTKNHALAVVRHFTSLTHLSLPSNMISPDLLTELARRNRVRLENMRILVVYSTCYEDGLKIPRLSWQDLHQACPDLEVEVVFNSRVPSLKMAQMLRAEMPVSTLYFMKYARCSADDIGAMAIKFKDTLKKFVSYADTDNADNPLLHLVNSCQQLHTLIFYGSLNFKTAMELAESKGKKWYQFILKKDTIDLTTKQPDPDKVLDWDEEKNEYSQVDLHKWGDTEESLREKEERFKVMLESVTESIGWTWQPFSPKAASQ